MTTDTVFDPYVPSTWLTAGLEIVRSSTSGDERGEVNAIPRVVRMVQSVARVSVLAVGMAVVSLPFVSRYGAAASVEFTQRPNYQAGEGDVPPGYWAAMGRVVRSLPTLPPDDMSFDPPPLG